MKKRSILLCATAALIFATTVAGCGKTSYFAGRTLPPSGILNRVLIAIQNPSPFTKGALPFVDAYYDIRSGYSGKPASFSISGYGALAHLHPEHAGGNLGHGLWLRATAALTRSTTKRKTPLGARAGCKPFRQHLCYSQPVLHLCRRSGSPRADGDRQYHRRVLRAEPSRSLPSERQPRQLSGARLCPELELRLLSAQAHRRADNGIFGRAEHLAQAAVDCEPQIVPNWCLFQAQSPDHVDATGTSYGAPLVFDRPVKAVFSADGGTAYVLNCGPECGGNKASVTPLPVAPTIFVIGQQSGTFPTNATLASSTISIPGGASNALVSTSTMYVVGQQPQQVLGQTLFAGELTVVNLANNTASNPIAISDGAPGAVSRMLEADDNTLWIGMTKCTNGVRAATGLPYGCLTMFNTSSDTVTTILPYIGDATGIAAVTGLHKVYSAQGGQVYINSTVDGSTIDNQYVTVTGTAYDVAYMDATSDSDNTVY